MYHDRTGSGARSRGWLRRLLASGDDAASVRSVAAAPFPAPPFPAPPAAELSNPLIDEGGAPLLEPADLTNLAEHLAGLIAAAQSNLDGAMTLTERSADDAAAYGEALAADAQAIDTAGLPLPLAESLMGLTRAMIERTQAAEARLRATNHELRGLRRDLDAAQESAERDPLTGLPNRRGIENALRCAVAAAEHANSALAVGYCDIDAFKRLNEAHGYALGDRVLRLVADSLTDGLGEEAQVGRQSSEAFVMLFEGVDVAEAAARIDAVRESLAARTLRSRSDGRPIGTLTFSAGVAGLRQGEEAESVLERADALLVSARRRGGNQVVTDAED